MEQTKSQCRHVRTKTMPATTTLHHKAIAGRSRAELDNVTELCALCSGAVSATLLHLEAEEDVDYKRSLSAMLGAMHEASVK